MRHHNGKPPRFPRTALHVIGALSVVVGLFAVMLVMTLLTLARLEAAEKEVVHLDQAKHAAHIVEAQIREQYIHQAHSIIEGDLSHLDHYRRAVETTKKAIAQLHDLARRPEDRREATKLAKLARLNDQQFSQRVVPAIRKHDRAATTRLHREIVPTLQRVTRVNAELSRILNGRAASAQARAKALRARTRTVALLCFSLALVIATLVVVLLSRRISKRISTLRVGAQQLSRGDLHARISIEGNDEYSELATTFNQMATDLDEHQQRLLTSQRLASIGQVAAGVAHEINNPLGVILGYVRILSRDASEKQQQTIDVIADETRLCQRIVEDLLDPARPQHLRCAQIDLSEIAREAIRRLREAGRLEDVTVNLPAETVQVAAWADEERLMQVVTNLITNAVEAAGNEGSVEVATKTTADKAALLIADSGPGFAAETVRRAFEPFFTTKPSGVGLGLAISQAIIDAHGGRITIERAPAGGALVSIMLPTTEPGGAL
ncbi:MAG: HAMP domain-containing protein [Deltaproteobacteria bacterium]|nr:HAMP domain-containing protein [Deltaproteobacteria bacterium]